MSRLTRRLSRLTSDYIEARLSAQVDAVWTEGSETLVKPDMSKAHYVTVPQMRGLGKQALAVASVFYQGQPAGQDLAYGIHEVDGIVATWIGVDTTKKPREAFEVAQLVGESIYRIFDPNVNAQGNTLGGQAGVSYLLPVTYNIEEAGALAPRGREFERAAWVYSLTLRARIDTCNSSWAG